MSEWKSASHNKYLLQYHLIFVCKYRKKLLVSQYVADDVKRLSTEIGRKHRVNIKYMECPKNKD
ncbi:MAG: IS200/IS605 family transposase, partial [Erysipelotrichia bacterium]|nr:IS200/IS605 family transposase [Erysipelotrichia bacterium]